MKYFARRVVKNKMKILYFSIAIRTRSDRDFELPCNCNCNRVAFGCWFQLRSHQSSRSYFIDNQDRGRRYIIHLRRKLGSLVFSRLALLQTKVPAQLLARGRLRHRESGRWTTVSTPESCLYSASIYSTAHVILCTKSPYNLLLSRLIISINLLLMADASSVPLARGLTRAIQIILQTNLNY